MMGLQKCLLLSLQHGDVVSVVSMLSTVIKDCWDNFCSKIDRSNCHFTTFHHSLQFIHWTAKFIARCSLSKNFPQDKMKISGG